MNLQYLREGLDLITYHSCSFLGPEQILLVEHSLCILQNENKLKEIFFWGRIDGIERDYYIALGYTNDCLRERKFFYSTNCHQWISLLPPKLEIYEACILCREKFLGDPSSVTSVKLDPKFTIDENQIILATEPVIDKIKEEDRLAVTLYVITEESAMVPRGALYRQVDMNVIHNPSFHGLDELQAPELTNYQLYRMPRNKYNYNLLKRSDYNYPIDFLDTLDDIIPEEYAFSVCLEKCDRISLIKSLIWPGMVFFHKLCSRKHGFVYFGDGKKNFDLLFMI